jgi:hypothetical protein
MLWLDNSLLDYLIYNIGGAVSSPTLFTQRGGGLALLPNFIVNGFEQTSAEAVFLVMCDPSMNELRAT